MRKPLLISLLLILLSSSCGTEDKSDVVRVHWDEKKHIAMRVGGYIEEEPVPFPHFIQDYYHAYDGVPICYEWSHLDREQFKRFHEPYMTYSIPYGMQFEDSIEEVIKGSNGAFSYEKVNGMPCFLPANKENTINLLDEIISIHVENVSAWEAMQTMLLEVNRKLWQETGKQLTISIRLRPMALPPHEFELTRNITIKMRDVTAREVLCEIMHQSTLRIIYSYENTLHYVEGVKTRKQIKGIVNLMVHPQEDKNGKPLEYREKWRHFADNLLEAQGWCNYMKGYEVKHTFTLPWKPSLLDKPNASNVE